MNPRSLFYVEKWPGVDFRWGSLFVVTPANHSNTNRVITILIHSVKTLFQNVFVTLLRCVAKDVTLSLLSWRKRYDFNAANFRRHSQWKCALQTQWIRIKIIWFDLFDLNEVFIHRNSSITVPSNACKLSSKQGQSWFWQHFRVRRTDSKPVMVDNPAHFFYRLFSESSEEKDNIHLFKLYQSHFGLQTITSRWTEQHSCISYFIWNPYMSSWRSSKEGDLPLCIVEKGHWKRRNLRDFAQSHTVTFHSSTFGRNFENDEIFLHLNGLKLFI